MMRFKPASASAVSTPLSRSISLRTSVVPPVAPVLPPSCFETAASPPPQHEAYRAGADGAGAGKGYHVRAFARHLRFPRVILLGLSPALPRSQKMCAQDQQVM